MKILLFDGVALRKTNGESLPVSGGAGRLLAYLALADGRAVTREEAATALWPNDDKDTVLGRLRQSLHLLRIQIESAGYDPDALIDTSRTRIRLDPQSANSDVRAFEDHCDAARSAIDAASSIPPLQQAMELYRGPLAPEYDGDWIEPHRSRLAAIQRVAVLALARAQGACGELDQAIRTGLRAVSEEPLSEETHRLLMELYAAAGRPGEVLRQYRELEQILAEELGEEPSTATRELATQLRIRAGDFPGADELTVYNGNGRHSAIRASIFLAPDRRLTYSGMDRRRDTLRPVLIVAVLLLIASIGWWTLDRTLRPASARAARTPEQRLIWSCELPEGPGQIGVEPRAMVVSNNNDVYVSSLSKRPNTDVDYFTAGYSTDGHPLPGKWPQYYDGPNHDLDRVVSATWAGVNLAVVGESDNGHDNHMTHLPGLDITTIWYDPAGNAFRTDRWNSPHDGEDSPESMACGLRSFYVVGHSWLAGKAPSARYGWAVLHYDMAGPRKWVKVMFDEPETIINARATDVAMAAEDAVVVGYVIRKTARGLETIGMAVQIRDSDGVIVWKHELCASPGVDERRWRIVPASPDGFAIIGRSHNTPGSERGEGADFLTIKLDGYGNLKWSRTWNGPTNRDDSPECVTVGRDGRTYVSGWTVTTPGSQQIATVCYSTSGDQLWVREFTGHDTGINCPKSITLNDKAGGLYVGGFGTRQIPLGNGEPSMDALLLKYNLSGNLNAATWFGMPNEKDFIADVKLDGFGNVYATGQTVRKDVGHGFLRKFAP